VLTESFSSSLWVDDSYDMHEARTEVRKAMQAGEISIAEVGLGTATEGGRLRVGVPQLAIPTLACRGIMRSRSWHRVFLARLSSPGQRA